MSEKPATGQAGDKTEGAQFRAARAMLGLTTRDVARALGCSAMAITKLERGEINSTPQARLYFAAIRYYEGSGLAFYAGGVIPCQDPDLVDMVGCLRARFNQGKHGSAYALAFDRLVSAALNSDLKRMFDTLRLADHPAAGGDA